MITVESVTKSYGPTVVIDEVSLNLPAAGIISLIGPNGAGKSTLLSLISRLLPMDTGTVHVDGLDVSKAPSDLLARRLSILRQDNHVVSRLTVRDLVSFGRYPHTKGRLTENDKGHIETALEYLDLITLADRFLDELSGGQRQRAFVAMVLCQDTDYVLLDEPLNNLDMKHAAAMMKLIRHASKSLNKVFVLVLHDINFASCYSDHVIAMRDGKVLHYGRPEDIMQPAILRELYDVDVEVHDIDGKKICLYFNA